MNESNFLFAERLVQNTVMRRFLHLNMSNLHTHYDYYFRYAFEPGNGKVVPFLHSPKARKDAIGWFSQTYDTIGGRVDSLGARYVR